VLNTMLARLREWAAALQREVMTLWFACRDPRTPLAAKLLATLIAAYALSPIDLIPDFIPVLGLIDELLLLPGAIYLVMKLVPAAVLHTARAQARVWMEQRATHPVSYGGALIVMLVWLVLLYGLWWIVA
jgi:uncharacterized membrane protein YkvA (DUF1232 family)